ncbi:MAG: YceI family protein [Roseivirga sp.]|nr:YceI family protein [Roseivirga sp.]
MKSFALIAVIFICTTSSQSFGQEIFLLLDKHHSHIQFEAGYLGLMKQRGNFNKFDCIIRYDASLTQALVSLTVMIDLRTIDTNNRIRDKHLKSPDFLDATEHPYAVFQSSTMSEVQPGKFLVTGLLKLKGVQKEMTIEVQQEYPLTKDRNKNLRIGFTGEFQIDRREFNILGGNAHNDRFDVREQVIDNLITIQFSIQSLRQVSADWPPVVKMIKAYQETSAEELFEQYETALKLVNNQPEQASETSVENVIALIELSNLLVYQRQSESALKLLSPLTDIKNPLTKKGINIRLEGLYQSGKKADLQKLLDQLLEQGIINALSLELSR